MERLHERVSYESTQFQVVQSAILYLRMNPTELTGTYFRVDSFKSAVSVSDAWTHTDLRQ